MTSILALYKNTSNVTINSVIGKDKYIYILQQVRRDFLLRLKYQIQPLHGITVLFKLITMQGHQNTTITRGMISKDTAHFVTLGLKSDGWVSMEEVYKLLNSLAVMSKTNGNTSV